MPLTITHSYVTPKPEGGSDGPPGGLVGSTEWNDDHVVTGFPYQEAGSNLNFYVSTTGSDSNPGTQAEPFATIGQASSVVGLFDYEGNFFPTINVEDGTYTESVGLPGLINIFGQGVLVGNNTTPGGDI